MFSFDLLWSVGMSASYANDNGNRRAQSEMLSEMKNGLNAETGIVWKRTITIADCGRGIFSFSCLLRVFRVIRGSFFPFA